MTHTLTPFDPASRVSRYDPYRSFARLDPLRRIDDFFSGFPMFPGWGADAAARISIDVSEDEKTYQVDADIPGASKENIKVAIEGKQVSIDAQTESHAEENGKSGMLCRERCYGHQTRSFVLSHEVDESKAEAKYANGVLHLSLPKRAGGSSKQISVR